MHDKFYFDSLYCNFFVQEIGYMLLIYIYIYIYNILIKGNVKDT